MSTSVCTEKCPKCGKEALFVDFACRTGEYDTFCEFCGFGQHFSFLRNENFDIIREDTSYPMAEVFLVVKSYETGDVYLEKCVADIPDFNNNSVDNYLNHVDGYRFDEFEDGINNFYWVKNGEYKQLFYRGNEIDVDVDKQWFIVHHVKTDYSETAGCGHIIFFDDTSSRQIAFTCETTKEEALAAVEEAKKTPGLKEMFASWLNKETGEFEILFGEYKEEWETCIYPSNAPATGDCSDDVLPF